MSCFIHGARLFISSFFFSLLLLSFYIFVVFILFVICASTFVVGENAKTCSLFHFFFFLSFCLSSKLSVGLLIWPRHIYCIFTFKTWITFYYWCSELLFSVLHDFALNFKQFSRQNGTHHDAQFHVSIFISFHLTKGFSNIFLIAIKGDRICVHNAHSFLSSKRIKSNHKNICSL